MLYSMPTITCQLRLDSTEAQTRAGLRNLVHGLATTPEMN